MWLLNRILLSLFLIQFSLYSQNCSFSIKGTVLDEGTDKPLEAVAVFLQEEEAYSVTDSKGFFSFDSLCHADYHLVLSHIGCEPKSIHIHLHSDTTIEYEMDHSTHFIQSVTVDGHHSSSNYTEEHIHAQEIIDNSSENLAETLEAVEGVSMLRNGSISKPIIHGMYGSRLTILNNEIPQAGQQWGNDHAPEIDPLSANQIRIIKGSGALEYLGGNLGNVILVEPTAIAREPHVHGKTAYSYESNGRGHGIHTQLQQYSGNIGWRMGITAKKRGDQQTASYFLNNTGNEELNFFLQLENNPCKHRFNSLYISSFNTRLGVLRGGHIGNLTDLNNAFEREEPLFTEDTFSYQIDAPKQEVNHHLIKFKTKRIVDSSFQYSFVSALQFNDRREFDVRRSGRTAKPSLSLQQYAFYNSLKLKKEWNHVHLNTGIQLNAIDNTNIPETGILPLIPDYLSYQTGAYFILNKQYDKSILEGGARFDYFYQSVVIIDRSAPSGLVRYLNLFPNASANILWKHNLSEHSTVSSSIAFGMRNPAINEMYSQGLHQGVGAIEEGSIDLLPEQSTKAVLSYQNRFSDAFYISTYFYYQSFSNYIYLLPSSETRLTIRGAFPVFEYDQTSATIYGSDIAIGASPIKGIDLELKYSFIEGIDRSNNRTLPFIPTNRLRSEISYEFAHPINIGKRKIQNLKIEGIGNYVGQKLNIAQDQDFLAPPEAYFLLGAKVGGDLLTGNYRWRIVLKGENLLNISYRDYLNRMRYFADDLGRSISLGLILKF